MLGIGMRSPQAANVLLAVTDTGHGMAPEIQEQIFEPFFTTKPHGQGTGLGLSTVYGIVAQSKGTILLYSEPGRGTSFKVYLPFYEGNEPAHGLPGPSVVPTRGTETVLLVEDEEGVRQLARQVLEMNGYVVLSADNGETALELCAQYQDRIHLLITDVVMPRMGGNQLVDRLQANRSTLKILYMSGYTDTAIVHQGIVDPHPAFLQKPFTPDALALKVREVLDGA
jgi:two-component system, cell cycle sensor histidine kinase and response regulator CckA